MNQTERQLSEEQETESLADIIIAFVAMLIGTAGLLGLLVLLSV